MRDHIDSERLTAAGKAPYDCPFLLQTLSRNQGLARQSVWMTHYAR